MFFRKKSKDQVYAEVIATAMQLEVIQTNFSSGLAMFTREELLEATGLKSRIFTPVFADLVRSQRFIAVRCQIDPDELLAGCYCVNKDFSKELEMFLLEVSIDKKDSHAHSS